jgi:hypothetical protein
VRVYKTPEKRRAYLHARYHSPKGKRLAVEAYQRYYKKSSTKRVVFDRWLRNAYGVTREIYDTMLIETGGRCDICAQQFSDECSEPHLDHSHGTGAVRGLLCRACNLGLAQIDQHGLGWAEKAVAYMRRPQTYE